MRRRRSSAAPAAVRGAAATLSCLRGALLQAGLWASPLPAGPRAGDGWLATARGLHGAGADATARVREPPARGAVRRL